MEFFSTICIEGKTNEASGRAPADPPGAQKFKADPEQDPRVPIAFHPRGLLNFQSCYKKANSPLRNDSVTATSLRIKSREAYPNAGIAAVVLTGKNETPENEQFLAPGVFCCLKAAHPVGGFLYCSHRSCQRPQYKISPQRLTQMRLTDETYSRQLTITVSKCSPSGTMRRGERVLKLKILHCTYEVHMRKKEKMTIGPHPSECWKGGRGAAG